MKENTRRRDTWIAIALALTIALVAIAFVIALSNRAHRPRPASRLGMAGRTTPPAPPPEILLRDLTPDQARASNAAAPFAAGPVVPAAPFRYHADPADLSAAEACLAAAVLYEAGDDPPGEKAVAQVIVNRLRHPSFPKTVCGVVFQGSERATGCQFTFTCDGALGREVGGAAWARAHTIAHASLTGSVDRAVGTATHYHADYVVPYWRNSLRKIAAVHSQIFYTFPGYWGRPAALTGRPAPPEQPDPRLLRHAPELAIISTGPDLQPDAAIPRQSLAIAGVPAPALKGAIVRLKDEDAVQYALELGRGDPGGWAVVGYTICAGHPDCLVLGWTEETQVPRALPVLPAAMASVAFMYRKSSLLGVAQPRWDCRRYRRPLTAQCLPR